MKHLKHLSWPLLRILFASIALVPSAAWAQNSDCELHVWPTSQFGAVYHGASAGMGTYGPVVTRMTLTPMEEVAKRLAESVDPAAQKDAIDALGLDQAGRFSGYRLVFHDAPVEPKYGNWVDKNVGVGGRDSESKSLCYAELHVVFITLFRTAISKKIQTGFLFRDFGASQSMESKAVDAGSTGAADFDSNGEAKSPEAMASVRNAFQENLRIFLRKKKMRAKPT
jgi:hypothetical protein